MMRKFASLMCRQVTDAEAEVTNKAEERAKVWKTKADSNTTSSNTTPNTSVEIIPKSASAATSSKTDPDSWSSPVKGESLSFKFTNPCLAPFLP